MPITLLAACGRSAARDHMIKDASVASTHLPKDANHRLGCARDGLCCYSQRQVSKRLLSQILQVGRESACKQLSIVLLCHRQTGNCVTHHALHRFRRVFRDLGVILTSSSATCP